jgi:glycosyltransferase involved in cell wall biosynthesis
MADPLVSIVINNYNYAHFLHSAIESALHQDYPHCEVIVVDDGSQDGSAEIIIGYGDRIRSVFKENGGQASALNAGFESSRGEIVIFLDADDRLERQAAGHVADVFNRQPHLGRVQYRMAVIDAAGNPTGETKPAEHVPVPSGDIRQQLLHFPFDAAWLPTSGNAFSSQVLRRVMPIPAEYGAINADYYLVHTAPLLGPAIFIDRVLACYRVHGANNFEKNSTTIDLERLRTTIYYDELTFRWIRLRAREVGLAQHFKIPERNHSVSSAASRLSSLKLEPETHPVTGDRLVPLVALGVRSALGRFDISQGVRWVFATWFIIMGFVPRSLALWLADLFFFPERRQTFTRLLGRLYQQHSTKISRKPKRHRVTSSGKFHQAQQNKRAEGEEG